jgi:hypothetical protein
MGVAFGGAGNYFTRTTALPDLNATFTMMGWYYWASTPPAVEQLYLFNNIGSTAFDNLAMQADFQYGYFNAEGSNILGSTLTTGTWYHIAMVRAGPASLTGYLNGNTDITSTFNVGTSRGTVERLLVGNGVVQAANLKVWATALTQAEVQQEMRMVRPARYANLNLWTPNWPGSGERTRDYSGNGHDWSETGTPGDGASPPVSYGAPALYAAPPPAVSAPPATRAIWVPHGRAYRWARG